MNNVAQDNIVNILRLREKKSVKGRRGERERRKGREVEGEREMSKQLHLCYTKDQGISSREKFQNNSSPIGWF